MFQRWDIVYAAKFPDTIQCSRCHNHFSIVKHNCSHCGHENLVSHLIGKPRPIVVWTNQENWVDSMSFGIPTSATKLRSDPVNEIVLLPHYSFQHSNKALHQPMRVIISQSTRIDGNALAKNQLVGKITDLVVQKRIEEKLFNWIFS